ncbi:2-oxoglutarate oxidoreductase [Candidatus Bathyarchaeota archaeon]|nr:2-oxoglutarate oxidoreductase [Candidatus Bathyarchaeota archaeon]MCK4474772.1 2-oxoglutarate oxidoreductase [Candidatus Bathyarchaeota archaeon]
MKKVFERPKSMFPVPTHYCPGCGHGIVHRLLAEVIDEFGIRERVVGVGPVGCSVFIYNYINCDMYEAAHGRAPAIATGCKRMHPDLIVFTYQGDGDLASIGTAEIIHAANRGENITVLFLNNAIYGMTGGQMAPTTILGQKTTTSPLGRSAKREGYPIRIAEMLATLEGATYIARVSVHNPKAIIAAKRALKKAFKIQIEGLGFSLVEFLSQCPTGWGMSSREATKWVEEKMIPCFPLGEFKVPRSEKPVK